MERERSSSWLREDNGIHSGTLVIWSDTAQLGAEKVSRELNTLFSIISDEYLEVGGLGPYSHFLGH